MPIDADQIREAVAGLGLVGNAETGILRRFGVILANNSVDFLVGREVDLIDYLGPKALNLAEKVLIDAAQWCANATFGGIMASDEWKGLIEPQIGSLHDRFAGLAAITNCLGWGKITEFNLDEAAQKVEFTVEHSYYVDAWKKRFGNADRPICYMWTGVAGGYADLLFGGGVHSHVGIELACAAKKGNVCKFVGEPHTKKYDLS
jgi:hypothetical protein